MADRDRSRFQRVQREARRTRNEKSKAKDNKMTSTEEPMPKLETINDSGEKDTAPKKGNIVDKPLHRSSSSSSSSSPSSEEGDMIIKDKSPAAPTAEQRQQQKMKGMPQHHGKKGILEKIKPKLPGFN